MHQKKIGMLPGRGLVALLFFNVLCVFFVVCAPANDGLGMLVFVSMIAVVVVFGMFRFSVCFLYLFVIFVMGAAANDGLGMLAGREIEGKALLLHPHPTI